MCRDGDGRLYDSLNVRDLEGVLGLSIRRRPTHELFRALDVDSDGAIDDRDWVE